jgi:hypothetical protein
MGVPPRQTALGSATTDHSIRSRVLVSSRKRQLRSLSPAVPLSNGAILAQPPTGASRGFIGEFAPILERPRLLRLNTVRDLHDRLKNPASCRPGLRDAASPNANAGASANSA